MRVERSLPVTTADGTRLLVDHHPPSAGGRTHPSAADGWVVWIRTPYGRKGIASIARWFAKSGAHVVVEAVRGTDGSEGTFDATTFAPRDALDVAAWMRAQPWFGGAIVTWGLSAIGYASWGLAGLDIPEWRLALLQDAQSELRDAIVFPGGAFAAKTMLGYLHSLEWQARHPRASFLRTILASVRGARRAAKVLAELPLSTADQRLVGRRVDHFQDWLVHENDDDYWKRFDLRRNAAGMPAMVHLATGWYDICLASVLADFRVLREAGKHVRLLVGPWYHGRGAVDVAYRSDTELWLRAVAENTGAPPSLAVRVHVGGADQWRDLADWPPPGYEPTAWHLQPAGRLLTGPAPLSSPDRYRYDPARPTPAVGGAMENLDGAAGAKDNRKLEARDDVLTYTTDAFATDTELVGPARATVVIRSTCAHTDLLVRLCDVHPDGRSVNLCDGARRLRPDHPPAASDGTRTVEIDLTALAYQFKAGHRLRVQISSGAHPRLHRNTGTGEPLGGATTLRTADQEIFHDPAHPSVINLPTAG